MSASEKAAEVATEVVAETAEAVADQAEHFAEAARNVNALKVQFGLLGVIIGATTASLIAYKVAYAKAETKFSEIADTEIAEMREHYREKAVAAEAQASKEDLDDIVRERGYTAPEEASATPPMAIAPPARVVEEVKEDILEKQPEETTVIKDPEVRNVFKEHADDAPVVEWDQQTELRRRSPDIPYVIHYDERHEFENYEEVTLTYFEADDVLCRDQDEVIDPADRERLVGERNLERFGHGSNDHNVVYIRNDKVEMIFEIVRSPRSYAEEVHGLSHDSGYGRNVERMRARERRRPEDE